VLEIDVIFATDEFDEFIVGHEALVGGDGPGLVVGLGIVDGDFIFRGAVVGAAEAFGDVGLATDGASLELM
jgi:hypothetical protein